MIVIVYGTPFGTAQKSLQDFKLGANAPDYTATG